VKDLEEELAAAKTRIVELEARVTELEATLAQKMQELDDLRKIEQRNAMRQLTDHAVTITETLSYTDAWRTAELEELKQAISQCIGLNISEQEIAAYMDRLSVETAKREARDRLEKASFGSDQNELRAAIDNGRAAKLRKSELDGGEKTWHAEERKRQARRRFQCMLQELEGEMLSFTTNWRTDRLKQLDDALQDLRNAGIPQDEMAGFEKATAKEHHKRDSREELFKTVKSKGSAKDKNKLHAAVMKARAVGLLNEEIQRAEAARYAMSGGI